ncbi:MAG: hypothetical protein Q4F95_04840 [Oscillospiraceae bacterium]|nr:hypothetical protein [Oscillospiraceae bacterium]
MKKIFLCIVLTALILSGCSLTRGGSSEGSGNSQTETEKTIETPSSKKLNKYREKHSSDNRSLVVSYRHGNCGFGCEFEFFDMVIDLYNDSTLDVYGSTQKVPDELSCCETFTLSDSQYNDIIKYIQKSRIDKKSKVLLSPGNCDDVDYYMQFYYDNQMYNRLGGYGVNDNKFCKLADMLNDCVADEDYVHIRDGFEDNYKKILGYDKDGNRIPPDIQ